jgi:pantoate--beta-alanine ligase
MGALHQGHISLIEECKSSCELTVCSIFINPTQFNDSKDFEKYPVTISNDIFQLETSGCDILFLPGVEEIYPNGTTNLRHYNLGSIENLLEGKYRPGHFQGVCQVVHRLLEILSPDIMFLGQKDYQQCMVVKKLVDLLKLPVKIKTVNTFRESSGLAMSSRNLRLSERQKEEALSISKTLNFIKHNFKVLPHKQIENDAKEYLLQHGFAKVDYVSIVNAETLQPAEDSVRDIELVALIAATIGETRLIDNMILDD